MHYRSKMLRRTLFFTLCALLLVVVVLIVFLIAKASTHVSSAELISLVGNNITSIVPASDHLLAVDGNQLYYITENGQISWAAPLPETGMNPVGSSSLNAVYSSHHVMIFDSEGRGILDQQTDYEILDMSCGSSTYALTTWEEQQRLVHVLRLDATEVEQLRFPYETVLDTGFYASDLSQLWALSLDSHFTIPVAHLKTFNPGKSTTGNMSMNNEIAYNVLPVDDQFVAVGTHYLRRWDAAGKNLYSQLVYGWTLVDMSTDKRGKARFLLTPSNSSDIQAPLSSLWYIHMDTADSAVQYRLNLPAGTLWAAFSTDHITVFAENGIYTMTYAGENQRFYAIDTRIESVVAVLSGKLAVLNTVNGLKIFRLS